MPVHNRDIADIFNKMADLLEIKAANPFRVRAYRDAARIFGGMAKSASDMIAEGADLTEIPGIGDDLAEKIREIVETGSLAQLTALEKELPSGIHDLMRIPGLGARRVQALYEQLGIGDPASLEEAARAGRVRQLDGFGARLEANILEEVEKKRWSKARTPWHVAEAVARDLLAYLQADDSVKQAAAAGSFRRRKETVGDLDILVTCRRGSDIMDHFISYGDVEKVISRGKTRSSVRLRSGLQVDLRKLPQVGYGAGLHYFTGAKAHNIAVRRLGQKKGLKINEYGVFKGDKRVAGRSEASVYAEVGLPCIAPELREDRGEIEAAQRGELPELIRIEDIRGDLHVHTDATDGSSTLAEMADGARARGWEYLAITDHSQHLAMARGLDARRLLASVEAIDRLNETLKDFRILKSIEVDILKDGSLDLPDEVLKVLDLTVCAVHSAFGLSRDLQTERILRAMDNPFFGILAHPTGRLINEREPYDVDLERLIEAAAERGCFMELNAHPKRLDLTAPYCQAAREKGVKIAISTDAHSVDHLDDMRFGIHQARRGWLAPGDVLNTRGWGELKKLLKR